MGAVIKAVLSRNVGDGKPVAITVLLPVYKLESDGTDVLHPDMKRFLGNDIEITYPDG